MYAVDIIIVNTGTHPYAQKDQISFWNHEDNSSSGGYKFINYGRHKHSVDAVNLKLAVSPISDWSPSL